RHDAATPRLRRAARAREDRAAMIRRDAARRCRARRANSPRVACRRMWAHGVHLPALMITKITPITRLALVGIFVVAGVTSMIGCSAGAADDGESADSEDDLLTAAAAKTAPFVARHEETPLALVSLKQGDAVS